MTTYGPNNQPWVIKRGDTGKPIRAQLRDVAGPVDLTGCNVRFLMREVGDTVNFIDQPATLVNAPTGEVKYEWQTGNLSNVGEYNAEFEVTLPLGDIMTFPTVASATKRYIRISVIPDLG